MRVATVSACEQVGLSASARVRAVLESGCTALAGTVIWTRSYCRVVVPSRAATSATIMKPPGTRTGLDNAAPPWLCPYCRMSCGIIAATSGGNCEATIQPISPPLAADGASEYWRASSGKGAPRCSWSITAMTRCTVSSSRLTLGISKNSSKIRYCGCDALAARRSSASSICWSLIRIREP